MLTRPNVTRVAYFMLIPMVATGPASSQMKGLTAKVFADSPTYSTTVASNQNAQSQNAGATGKPDESLLILRTAVSEVHLVFTVTDKHGHYIKGLKQDDFKILDDGKPPQEILSFHGETDLPLLVGLLIDTSQSVRDRFKFEQEAAIAFLSQTIRPEHDQSFVIGFNLKSEVTQDFTADRDKLVAGIHMLKPGSLTAVYDALYYACRDKLRRQAQAGPVRRAIILLSDGNDNASNVTRERAIEMAQQAEVAVYTISTNLTRSGGKGRKNLERIADATGGRSYAPRQITEVAEAFASIQEELRSQYAVSYKPEAFKLDDHYRTIE
ncbi:MAG TPA: VWA domain-containing protein, partial [Candidatus Sulfotelmatobacter sp.]